MLETEEYKKILDSFYDYLFGVIKLHRDYVPKLKDELMLLQGNSIDELSDNLNHQQSFLYQIKNFDQDVKIYTDKLGITAKTLSEAIQQLSEVEQVRFNELLQEYRETAKEINFYKDKCQSLLQTKLYAVNKKMAQIKSVKDKVTYSEDGKEEGKINLPSSFEKSI